MTDDELSAIRARAEAALTAICAVAARGDRAFRMSIPPQEDDTDMLVFGVCDDVRALVAEVKRRRAEAERITDFIDKLDALPHMNRVMTWGPNGCFTTFEDMRKAERAIASALGGFTADIQSQYRELVQPGDDCE